MKRRTVLATLGAFGVMGGSLNMRAQAATKDSPKVAGWQNWSRSLPTPKAPVVVPEDTTALKALINKTEGGVRPVGSGHSWTGLVPCDGAIVQLDNFNAIGAIDADAQTAWLGAGARLKDLSPGLADKGLAFRNLGDIDVQTLAGSTSTATHGTGATLPCLAAEIKGLRMVTGAGEDMEISAEKNSDLLPVAQVGLGALGILTEIQMQLVARHKLHRRVWFAPYQDVLSNAEAYWAGNRNFEFMYLPFSDTAMCISHNITEAEDTRREKDESDDGVMQLKALRDWLSWFPYLRKKLLAAAISGAPEEDVVGESWQLLSSARNVHFNEMEFHLPVSEGLAALDEVRAHIERHRGDVFFPFECRMTAQDSAWLSPFNDGPRISVAVHTHAPDDYAFLFTEIEPIFRRRGGRPHWGKLNRLGGDDMRALYPQFDGFAKLRTELDPKGRLLNPYLRDLFGAG
ncbi:MAG: D-arabinono-1,4-lactone oxidase [Parvibaculales bacterium]